MKLPDAMGKIPATPGIASGTLGILAQCLNDYDTPGHSTYD
jgi:hypothetical protein